MKERRERCLQCGERFTVVRFVRERASAYCEWCREERRRVQARARMQIMQDRRRAQAKHADRVQRTETHAPRG